MKIDHLVANVSPRFQTSSEEITRIRNTGLLYEPKYGKGTSGFKASNIWIGDEYFELINILKKEGGGWKSDWTEAYNTGHKGVVCLFFDIEDIDALYASLRKKNIGMTEPEWLRFKWFFNLFTRTMPWRNSYLPYFQKMPLQFGFQQMKDEKSRDFMQQYMYPNSRERGILAISEIEIGGEYTQTDISLIQNVFPDCKSTGNGLEIAINGEQRIKLTEAKDHRVIISCKTSNEKYAGNRVEMENFEIRLVG